jgi:predicted nucleic acid-binding protein
VTDLVVDASAVIDLLVGGPRTAAVEQHAAGASLVAPDLLGVEVLSALARLARGGALTRRSADAASAAWARTSVERLPLAPVEERVWELRDRLRISDAYYVAYAQLLQAPLLTCDGRLARAPLGGVSVLLVT